MNRHRRILAGLGPLGLMFGCSAPAPTAHRGSTTTASPQAGHGPDATVAEATTSTEPDTESAGATTIPVAPAGPTTTAYVVTVPMDPPTTTTIRPRALPTTTLPENADEPDEFDARDATTARVSWYGDESGTHTANGERYDPSGLTFAHRSMAFGTLVKFCGPSGCVVARCSDRGPAAWTGKTFDLSQAAFARVAPLPAGVATVTWEVVG